MDNRLALELLKNLMERIDLNPENGKFFLLGNISSFEMEALKKAIAALDILHASPIIEAKSSPTIPAQSQDSKPRLQYNEGISPQPTFDPSLVLNALQAEQNVDEDIYLSLDFGTAMSKAFATIVKDAEVVEHLPLKLGKRAKQQDGLIYPVPSSLWVSDDGFIYVGQKAISLSLQDTSGKRLRFDSLKKELTMGLPETDLCKVSIPVEMNPSGVPFTKGNAITLYLAYLTDLACAELESYGHSRYTPRRFALPSWPSDKRAWGEDLLAKMLAKAQVVADTLHGRWDGGIPIKEAKAILDKVDNLDQLPDYLIKNGVTEPLAAGSSRLKKDKTSRGLVMVVDVGAGTSDLAMFLVVENEDKGIYNAYPISNCNQSLSMAGDTLDAAIISLVRQKEGLDQSHPDFFHIMTALRMQIRRLKEDIFRTGFCNYVLMNGARGTITKDEFLKCDEVQRFSQQLSNTFQEVLSNADRSFLERFKDDELIVVLTGGGATLPMTKELARGGSKSHEIYIRRTQAALVPEDFAEDVELSEVYPQLAVAIGGAMPDIINEKTSLTEMPGMAGPTNWHISRTQIAGT